jgi:hypothetical protein
MSKRNVLQPLGFEANAAVVIVIKYDPGKRFVKGGGVALL